MDKNNITSVKIPAGAFCGHNCSDGCIYWNPYDRDSNGRQYCCIMILTTIRESAKDVLVMKTNCFDCTEGVPHDVAFL